MLALKTNCKACGVTAGRRGWITIAISAVALWAGAAAAPAAGGETAGANAPATASEPAAIVVPGDARYSNQQSILIRYRWTGMAPKGAQMWISLDATRWLPWQWSDKPSEPFTFAPPRQGKILIALAPAEHETATLPSSGYQSLAIVFDWDKPLLRMISHSVHATADGQAALRLAWAAYDESFGERPMSVHWRHSAEEPWQQAARDLPNSGACEWAIPAQLAGKTFEVCLRATDLAGNWAEGICTVTARPATAGPAPVPARSTASAQASQPQATASRAADPSAPTAAAAEAERLCDLAQRHLSAGEFDAAEDMFREAVQTDPTYYAARLNLGILLQRRSRHAEAIGEYQAVLALRPDNVTAWRNLALAYMTTKDYAKARITLQKLLAVEGDDPQTWIDLGDVEMLMGRSQTARQCWEKAKSLSKPNSETAARAGKRLGVYGR